MSIGIALSGAGFRGNFYTGFLIGAREAGIVFNQYIGVSAGAFASILDLSGVDPQDFWLEPESPLYACWHKRAVIDKISKYYEKRFISEGDGIPTILKRCNEKLTILAAHYPNIWKPKLFTQFNTFTDLMQAQDASSNLPWASKNFPITVNGEKLVDGSLNTLYFPNKFLTTKNKILLQGSPPYRKSKDPHTFTFRPKVHTYASKYTFWGDVEVYRDLQLDGYMQALSFFKRVELADVNTSKI